MAEAPTERISRQRTLSEGQSSTLTFHNVCYTVKVKKPGRLCGRMDKKILNNVSGQFQPGMNAILGPTGSGKSSLLDIIAGRKDPRGLSGTLLVDGSKQPKNFKCMTGYVVQDDIVAGTLTVRENIMFSANLRLPPSVSQEEKAARVEDTLAELGLEKCANSKIGTEFIRGVSGGERKRCNIGMELIISPPVLFLDEPTTGLDASTANSVMGLLHSLSTKGRTIIFSIHQPRFRIFKRFDRLMLLSEGKTVYHGPAQEALTHFKNLGYECEEHNNPPDFFLDVILGDVSPVNNDDNDPVSEDENSGIGEKDIVAEMEEGKVESKYPAREKLATFLHEQFEKSAYYTTLHNEIDPIYSSYEKRVASGTEAQAIVGQYATSFPSQVGTLCARSLKRLVRDPQTIRMQFFLALVMGFLAGIIYIQLDNDIQSGVQNRVGAFFFLTINMVFSSISAVVIFIADRAIFVHENVSGFYRVSSYFVAKILFDLLPLRLLPTTLYCIITYFMIGLQVDVSKFFIFYLTLVLITFAAASIALFGSCVSRLYAVANLLCILIAILMMIFGGLLVNVDTLGDWIRWLEYLSMFRYAMKALYINELKDFEFCTTMTFPNGTEIKECDPTIGNKYLANQGIGYETAWDLWQNHVALLGILAFFLIFAYILLRNIQKYK